MMVGRNEYLNGEDNSKRRRAEQQATVNPAPPARQSDPKAEVTFANVRKYVSAEMSLQLYGPVDDGTYENRKTECATCELRFDSSSMHDSVGFCKGCGCGVNERARLSVKLTMPEAECPKKKWGKAPGRHARLKDRVKAWIVKKIIQT